MKAITYQLTILFTLFLLFNKGTAKDTTLVFSSNSYQELFKLAKKNKKKILLYFHFDGCGACRTMEQTAFKNQEVIDFYENNFVSYSVNTLKGEGLEVNKLYKVEMHPTFLFLDEDGNPLHKVVGVFESDMFLQHAKDAMTPEKQLTTLKESYQAGNRSPDFLLTYTYSLFDAYEMDENVIREYLFTLSKEDLFKEENIRFIYNFIVHDFEMVVPYESEAFQFLLQNKEVFYPYFEEKQVAVRIIWGINDKLYKAIENKDEGVFFEMAEQLEPFNTGERYPFREPDGNVRAMITALDLILPAKMTLYKKLNDKKKYLSTAEKYAKKIWEQPYALNGLAQSMQKDFEEDSVLDQAKTYILKSIELKSAYYNNYTYTQILFKLGSKEEALEQARLTIPITKEAGKSVEKINKLLAQIEGELEK